MGQNINKIKTRINSINGAYKVTSAMKLVSSVKLKTWKYKLIQNQEFTNELKLACEDIFNYVDPLHLPLASNKNLNGKKLYIIVSSSLGLCGSYNSNIFKMTNSKITKDDDAIILGKKGLSFFKNGSFELIDSFKAYTSVKDEKIINQLMDFCVHKFMKDEYKEIHILYTKYKNAISFIPTDYCLLPLTMEQNKKVVGFNKKENKKQISYRSYVCTDWNLPKFNKEFFKNMGVLK